VRSPVHHGRDVRALRGEALGHHRAVQPGQAKVVSGVRKACQGRPVSEDDLARLAQQVEDIVRATGSAEIPSMEVGLAILGPLRELDEVAYLRFASVYRSFDTLDDFEAEIALLRAEGDPVGQEPTMTSTTTTTSHIQ
jgi:transcriptional repressor NrdR